MYDTSGFHSDKPVVHFKINSEFLISVFIPGLPETLQQDGFIISVFVVNLGWGKLSNSKGNKHLLVRMTRFPESDVVKLVSKSLGTLGL